MFFGWLYLTEYLSGTTFRRLDNFSAEILIVTLKGFEYFIWVHTLALGCCSHHRKLVPFTSLCYVCLPTSHRTTDLSGGAVAYLQTKMYTAYFS